MTNIQDGHKPSEFKLRKTESARLLLAKQVLGTEISLEDFVSQACEISAETLDVTRCGVWLFVDNESALRCVNMYENSGRKHLLGTTLQVRDFPEYFRNLRSRKVVSAESAAIDPKTSELYEIYLKPLDIQSMLDAPIFLEGKVVGVICHEQVRKSREWTTEERDFAASVADLVANKMKAAELNQIRQLLRRSEKRIMSLAKSETLAQMAVGVAHDFRNLLTAILTGGQLLADTNEVLSPDLRQVAQNIVQAALRASNLAKKLMEFGRIETERPVALVPQTEIIQLLPVLKAAISNRHEFKLNLSHERFFVLIDKDQFSRALMNLVLNARDAMPEPGTIEISVTVSISIENQTADLIVAVRDEGPGVDPNFKERIFEPFFTTKNDGSGLGLAIVERIVDSAGGFVDVVSEYGRGAEFRMHLPILGSDTSIVPTENP